jgi:hypothetical protein
MLTTIRDTIYNGDGTPLNGTVVIVWPRFLAFDGREIAAGTLVVPVTAGLFQVALEPSAGGQLVDGSGREAAYWVKIDSAGAWLSLEGWSVPASSSVLTVAEVLSVPAGGAVMVGVMFVDDEVPAGAADGSNTAFSLSFAPRPAGSLVVWIDGLRVASSARSVVGSALVFAVAPARGAVLACSYRH